MPAKRYIGSAPAAPAMSLIPTRPQADYAKWGKAKYAHIGLSTRSTEFLIADLERVRALIGKHERELANAIRYRPSYAPGPTREEKGLAAEIETEREYAAYVAIIIEEKNR